MHTKKNSDYKRLSIGNVGQMGNGREKESKMSNQNDDQKEIALITFICFIVVMIPILYLSFVNRASGDDYGYSSWTRAAWTETHSLIQVFIAAGKKVIEVYNGWQGTFTSVFLFTLQPEVFHEKAYVFTTFFAFTILFLSMAVFFYEILCKRLHFTKWNWMISTILFFLGSILFAPSFRSALYWYNGIIHYTLPYSACLVLTVLLLHFVRELKAGQYIGILLLMVLFGGSNYQAALFALIITFYIGGEEFFCRRNKKLFLLLFPIIGELAGLFVSMKAPGNKVRGGEEFGFSILRGIKTIGESFLKGILDIKNYLLEKPLVFIIFLVLFLFIVEAWSTVKEIPKWKNEKVMIAAIFCLYCAMQAPVQYAGVEVSGGVYNMNYWVFLLFFMAILILAAKKTAEFIKNKGQEKTQKWIRIYLVMPGVVCSFLLCLALRGKVKDSLWYVCIDYIRSGQAEDFREQMDLQTNILMNDSAQNVILPFINDMQGPLMHMPITSDPEAFTNMVARDFYGKASVIAIPRPEWEEKYGNIYEGK